MRKNVLLAVVVLVSIAFTYAYVRFDNSYVNKSNQLKVGLSADYPPFETIKNGEIVGFDVELIKAIAIELGREVVIKEMPFYSLVASLESGKIDIAISAINITPERKEKVDFSENYYYPKLSLVYLADNTTPDVQNLNGMKLGAQTGTTMEQWVKKIAANTANVGLVSMDTNPVLLEELKNKRIDIVVIETLQAKEYCKQDQRLSYVEVEQSSFGYSMAFPKNSSLTTKVNNALKTLQENGAVKQLEQKWLN